MKRNIAVLITLFFSLTFFLNSCQRGEKTGKGIETTQLMNMVQINVKKAIAFYKKNGMAAILKELNQPNGRFVFGSIYVFAYNLEGTVIAHPTNPSLIGGKLYDIPDEEGKFFRREVVFKAKTEGKGWVEYKYLEPISKKSLWKKTYIEKYDKAILCCGFYRK
jgi:signal transduction histidine kinase